MATTYVKGMVLTCSHEDCDCRLVVDRPCTCSAPESARYTCSCGAPMVEVSME